MAERVSSNSQRIDALYRNQPDVLRLIELLKSVESALELFVKCGNGLKWMLGIVAPIVGIWLAYHKWRNG